MKQTVPVVGVILTLLSAASVQAHHSPSAIFDMSRHISVTGTLTRVDWVNPHIVLMMEAKGEGGKAEQWKFESNPPSWYKSVGLARADFAKAIGHMITVEAVKARDGVGGKLGVVPGRILHLWHGDLGDRRYALMNQQFMSFGFDPDAHIRVGAHGTWEWSGAPERLRQWARDFFENRNEDGDRAPEPIRAAAG